MPAREKKPSNLFNGQFQYYSALIKFLSLLRQLQEWICLWLNRSECIMTFHRRISRGWRKGWSHQDLQVIWTFCIRRGGTSARTISKLICHLLAQGTKRSPTAAARLSWWSDPHYTSLKQPLKLTVGRCDERAFRGSIPKYLLQFHLFCVHITGLF